MVQILLNSHLQPKRVEIELLKMELRGIEPRSSHMRSEHSTSELQPRDMLHDAMLVLYSEPVGPVRLWLRMKWAEYPPEENINFYRNINSLANTKQVFIRLARGHQWSADIPKKNRTTGHKAHTITLTTEQDNKKR